MAPKRRAPPASQPTDGGKKAKGGQEEEEDAWSSALTALKTAPREKPPATIDGQCPLSAGPDAKVSVGRGQLGHGGDREDPCRPPCPQMGEAPLRPQCHPDPLPAVGL